MQTNNFQHILIIALSIFSISHARPMFVASLENDGSILAGIEYKGIGLKLPIIPARFGFTKRSDDEFWSSHVLANAQYWFSLTKIFDKKDYKTGVDWRFRYYVLDKNYDSVHTISGKGYENALGYYVSKEFGNIEMHAGGYLCMDYGINLTHRFYTDNEIDYEYSEDNIDMTAKILFGIMLRI